MQIQDAILRFQPGAVAMTPEEWQRGDSLIADYARNGQVIYG
ncbi:MAG: hypothetical protein P8Z79_13385 [Sedimentisphaerales bacterium]|jgi:hypothetical protein